MLSHSVSQTVADKNDTSASVARATSGGNKSQRKGLGAIDTLKVYYANAYKSRESSFPREPVSSTKVGRNDVDKFRNQTRYINRQIKS